MDLKVSLSYALDKAIKLGADKAEGGINQSEKKELNIEAGKMSLFRTTFQNSLSIEAIKDNKQGSVSINKIDRDSIDNAIKLLEFLLTKESQEHIVNNTFEYPMIDGVEPNKLIAQFGLGFKQDLKTEVSKYGKNQAAALKIMTEAGWE